MEPRKPSVILTPDNRLRVFISSTLKELAEEREVVRQSVLKLRLLPVMFEAGARPHPAQELYQAYLSQSHIFIGIYWQSYGWVGPGMEISGLEDEFNLSASLPRLIYVKSPAQDRDAGLQRMLTRLQQENTVSYKHFSSSAELGELVEYDLALLLSEFFESASRVPSAQSSPHPLTNIPFPRNQLLGRGHELETVRGWLSQDDTGLVTLTGPGGTGKSRLALEAALDLRGQFADGVFLVPLTPISDAARVLPTIAETLGLREAAQSSPVEEILKNFLGGRCILLLLDNFEQVLDAAPKIAGLLEACPRLKILATSRSPLRVRSERELFVQPLAVPNLKQAADSEHLSQYASVALFIQRAQSARPEFTVTNENAPAVAEICYRLDGLPLAIELAAARIKLLTPQELLQRLGHRFDILRGGTRDLPERQQTLRGAIDWSYNLLTDPARMLFRRLSVFRGGYSLDAAEAVCNLDDDQGASIFDQLVILVDSSLVTPLDGLEGQQRFGMLESLREYAFERLLESGEADRAQRAHAEYYLRFAREVEPRTRTAQRVHWRTVLEQDLENIRRALDWTSTSSGALEMGQWLTITLTYFWTLCGYIREGQHYCDTFLALSNEKATSSVRAELLSLAGILSLLRRGTKSVTPDWTGIIQTARQSGEKPTLAKALLLSGAWALASDQPVLAARYFEECQPLFHELSDEWSEVLAILWLRNTLTLRGESNRSRELFERGLAMARHQGDPWLLALTLIDVAQEAFTQGELEKAETTMREVEHMLRSTGEQWGLAWPLTALAQVQLMRGDLASAHATIAEALRLGHTYGNMLAQIFSLVEAACLLTLRYGREAVDIDLRKSEFANAARLCGGARPFAEFPFLLGSTVTRSAYDAMIAQVRSTMDAEAWEQGFAEGSTMPFEQALELATAELSRFA